MVRRVARRESRAGFAQVPMFDAGAGHRGAGNANTQCQQRYGRQDGWIRKAKTLVVAAGRADAMRCDEKGGKRAVTRQML